MWKPWPFSVLSEKNFPIFVDKEGLEVILLIGTLGVIYLWQYGFLSYRRATLSSSWKFVNVPWCILKLGKGKKTSAFLM